MNGSWEHIALGAVVMAISMLIHKSPWPAVWGMITVELVQFDAFGLDGRLVDTLHDFGMDAIGAGVTFFSISITL